jgi:hypothetical protein
MKKTLLSKDPLRNYRGTKFNGTKRIPDLSVEFLEKSVENFVQLPSFKSRKKEKPCPEIISYLQVIA